MLDQLFSLGYRRSDLKVLDSATHRDGNEVTFTNAILRKRSREPDTSISELSKGRCVVLRMGDDCRRVASNFRMVIEKLSKGQGQWNRRRRPVDDRGLFVLRRCNGALLRLRRHVVAYSVYRQSVSYVSWDWCRVEPTAPT